MAAERERLQRICEEDRFQFTPQKNQRALEILSSSAAPPERSAATRFGRSRSLGQRQRHTLRRLYRNHLHTLGLTPNQKSKVKNRKSHWASYWQCSSNWWD